MMVEDLPVSPSLGGGGGSGSAISVAAVSPLFPSFWSATKYEDSKVVFAHRIAINSVYGRYGIGYIYTVIESRLKQWKISTDTV